MGRSHGMMSQTLILHHTVFLLIETAFQERFNVGNGQGQINALSGGGTRFGRFEAVRFGPRRFFPRNHGLTVLQHLDVRQ